MVSWLSRNGLSENPPMVLQLRRERGSMEDESSRFSLSLWEVFSNL